MRNNQDGFQFSTGLLCLPQSLSFAMASCFRYVEPQTNRGQRKLKINTKVRNGRRRDRQGSKRTGGKKKTKKRQAATDNKRAFKMQKSTQKQAGETTKTRDGIATANGLSSKSFC